MRNLERARELFTNAGLAFPAIPDELAAQLKERDRWLFSTRELDMSPYNLQNYVHEVDRTQVADYALLCHSGHGVNSYAIQYYLVHGLLRMFLHLGWGGVYMDVNEDIAKIRDCFSLADQIDATAQCAGRFRDGEKLTVVGSDFYGSYWSGPGKEHRERKRDSKSPAEVLAEALCWLKTPNGTASVQEA
jgi:hypothetical protein